MMPALRILAVLAALSLHASAEWIASLDEARKDAKAKDRPLLVFIYDDT